MSKKPAPQPARNPAPKPAPIEDPKKPGDTAIDVDDALIEPPREDVFERKDPEPDPENKNGSRQPPRR